MATYESVIAEAYAKSKNNNPGVDASETHELMPAVHRALQGLFQVASLVSPAKFAKRSTVAYDAGKGGWPKPADADSVLTMQISGGAAVAVTEWDDPLAESGKPSVYLMNGVFVPTGVAAGPATTASLVMLHSLKPFVPTSATPLSTNVDANWDTQYDSLLAFETAIYLAIKAGDERTWEIDQLRTERDKIAVRFVMHLLHEVPFPVRRYGHVRKIKWAQLGALLAGGSALATLMGEVQ